MSDLIDKRSQPWGNHGWTQENHHSIVEERRVDHMIFPAIIGLLSFDAVLIVVRLDVRSRLMTFIVAGGMTRSPFFLLLGRVVDEE